MAKPILPLAGETFDTSETVIDSTWNTEEPDWFGSYTAVLLTLGDSQPLYSVVEIACGLGPDDEWQVDEVRSYDSILSAAENFTEMAGGR